MSYKQGQQPVREFNRAMESGGVLTQYMGVYLESEGVVTFPSSDVAVQCFGISMGAYTDGEKSISVVTRGSYPYIASDTHTFGTPLTLAGTSGRFRTALPGEPIAGFAQWTVGTIANKGLIELLPIPAIQGAGSTLLWNNGGTQITANVSPNLGNVAGTYMINWVYVEETAGNAITGGLNIGTTDDGQEIAATLTVGASTDYRYITSDLANVAWTLTANDEIFVHAETSWNSASIRLVMELQRVY